MARCKRCVVKRRTEGRKGGKIGDQIAKREKEVCAHLFPLHSCHFWTNQKYAFRVKQTISSLVFMQDIINEQIR